MKIAIIGYGKMGQEVEKAAIARNHQIISIIDQDDQWVKFADEISKADVAIEFSTPSAVYNNIRNAFNNNLPIIVGTTGWKDRLQEIKILCQKMDQSILYSSNFSIGVNLFFELNCKLAKLMKDYPDYDVNIEETHHTAKLDSPSGTAIKLADDILKIVKSKSKWVNSEEGEESEELQIESKRISNTPGTHVVTYDSKIDSIEIKHIAHNRKGFAQGAILAAEWIFDKKGVYTMRDVLNFK
jgi:4-hydroxy-tetrahydrodipicolinate reductase